VSEIITIFTFIFLAALPGRTTFLLLMLAASGNAKRIFIGAALAFLVQSFISILIGQALHLMPHSYVEIGAGVLFLYFSRHFWIESKKSLEVTNLNQIHSVKSVFVLIFMAEFGDVSQLAIATSASTSSSKTLVFFTAVGALWLLTALAVFVGSHMGRLFKPVLLQKLASLAFLVLGIYLCVKGGVSFF
jgi:putative Ca2+/H+ antiporter (TMEM165/GDT1 family)